MEMELTATQVEKLQKYYAENYSGIKDDFDDSFDYWLSNLTKEEITNLI